MTTLLTESFTGTTGAAWSGSIWGTTAGGTATIQSNAGRLVAASGAYSGGHKAMSAGVSSATTDTDFTGTVVMATAAVEQYAILGINGSGTDVSGAYYTPQGYALQLNYNATAASSTIQLLQITGGSSTSLASLTKSLTGTTTYSFRIQRVGTALRARVWTGTEPGTWDITATLSTAYAGYPFVGMSNGSASTARTATFDTFTVTDAASAPAYTASPALSGSGTLGLPGGGPGYSGPLTQWASALATVTTAPAKVLAIGASFVEGQGASTRANRWLNLYRQSLQSAYPSGATGGEGYLPPWFAVYANDSTWGEWRTSSSGTVANDSTWGTLGMRTAVMSAGAVRTYTFTGTDLDIWYISGGDAGTFTWKIDSGSATSVTASATYAVDNRVQVTGLSAASHTVTITATSKTYLAGFTVYNGDRAKGVQVFDSGHAGWTTDKYTGLDSTFDGLLNTIGPDLVILTDTSLNDADAGVSIATVQSRTQTLITRIKALTKVPSILLIADYRPQTDTSPAWSGYVSMLSTLATTNSIGFLDISAVMGPATTSGLFSSDGLHPSNSGHSTYAGFVTGATSPDTSTGGGVPGWAGSAALTGSGSLGATGVAAAAATGSPALSGSGSLGTAGAPKPAATTALSGSGTLSQSPAPAIPVTAALSGAGSLGASGTATLAASTALSGSGTLGAVATPAVAAITTLSGAGTLTAAGAGLQQATGGAVLSGAGSLAAGAVPAPAVALALGGGGALSTASAAATGGSAALSGSGALSTAGTPKPARTAALSGTGTLATTVRTPKPVRAVALSGSGALSAVRTPKPATTVALGGSGSMVAGAAVTFPGAADLSGAGALTVSAGLPALPSATSLSGTGVLATAGAPGFPGSAALSGEGTLEGASSGSGFGDADLSGAGALGTVGTPRPARAVALTGSGSLTAARTPMFGRAAALAGSGSLSGVPVAAVAAVVALAGTGGLGMGGVSPAPAASATLSGSGALAAGATGAATASTVALSGSGSLNASALITTAVNLSGSGSLGAGAAPKPAKAVAFSGIGVLGGLTVPRLPRAISFSGAGALSTAGSPQAGGDVALTGLGALATMSSLAAGVLVDLAGPGALAAGPRPDVAATTGLSGAGSLDAGAAIALEVLVDLAGSGQLGGSAAGGTAYAISLSGSGALVATALAVPDGLPFPGTPVVTIDTSGLRVLHAGLAPISVAITSGPGLRRLFVTDMRVESVDLGASPRVSLGVPATMQP